MRIEVKLEAFEGPLDLLLHLIEKNKIDIYDIPIAEITDQYMEYVNQMESSDLDTMSDFLLVAAQLINIKSRMLLPKEEKENGEETDPREELVNRLLEYKMYKYSAELLKGREDFASAFLFKEPTIPREVAEYEEKPEISEIIGDLTLAKLHNIFNFVIKKQTDKADPIRSNFGKIQKEPISLSEAINELQNFSKRWEMNEKVELKQLKAKIEAILFAMGKSVRLAAIAEAVGLDEDTVRKVIHTMMDEYEDEGHGISIIELEDSFQMCTKASMYETLIKVTNVPKKHNLTDALLETLSIVAYKQPVTRADIEAIRGVKSDHAVNKLIEYGLIEEAGRLQAPGKPLVFGTTEDFLRSFGIKSLEDLPVIGQETEDAFKMEAEKEAQLSFEDLERN